MTNWMHDRPGQVSALRDKQPARPSMPPSLSRRAFLSLAGSAAAGAVLAACAPRINGGSGPHGSSTVQLVYQDWRTDWFSGMA